MQRGSARWCLRRALINLEAMFIFFYIYTNFFVLSILAFTKLTFEADVIPRRGSITHTIPKVSRVIPIFFLLSGFWWWKAQCDPHNLEIVLFFWCWTQCSTFTKSCRKHKVDELLQDCATFAIYRATLLLTQQKVCKQYSNCFILYCGRRKFLRCFIF